MKIRTVSEGLLLITSRERWFFYLSWPLLVLLCGRVLVEFLDTGVPPIVLSGCAALVFAWITFACYAADTDVKLDRITGQFTIVRAGIFGAREEFRCALSGIRDVVLESQYSDERCYRIAFVTDAGSKYISRIFSGDSQGSVEKKYIAIRRYLFGDADSQPGLARRV